MNSPKKRLIIIGFDGAGPSFIERFMKMGKMPSFSKLKKEGYYTELLPAIPCDTPTNWTTLMTGAWAGTHGATSFFVHYPGEPLDKTHSTTNSLVCDAKEHLWDAAERNEKKCILINWPCSWPPTIKKGVQINGTGPVSGPWRISYGNVYSTEEWRPDKEVGVEFGQQVKIELKKAQEWEELPSSHSPPLETSFPLKGKLKYTWSEVGWKVEGEVEVEESDIDYYHLLLTNERGQGYDTVYITKEKDASSAVAQLKKGEWSEWIYEIFSKEEMLDTSGLAKVKDSKVPGVFKFKLIDLSSDGTKLTLFRTDIWLAEGWSFPEDLAAEINQTIGPFTEGSEVPAPVTRYNNDWDTYAELLHETIRWYSNAAEYLTQKNPDWDFLAVQIHVQDGINHVIAREITPGFEEYDKEKSSFYWDIYELSYKAIDTLVGEILRRCHKENTTVALVSDHCAIPTSKRLWVHIPLIEAGLLAYKHDGDGKMSIDWVKTKAVPRRTYIWVNLLGRDPDGIVSPEEYEKVRQKVIDTLNAVRDPKTGECPFEAVLRKENLEVYGQWGGKVGDLMYFMRPGYTDADINYLHPHKEDLNVSAVGETVVRCAHHQYLPTAKLGPFTNSAFFILNGNRVREGYQRPHPAFSVDVAPTLAFLSGIPIPKSSEGKLLLDTISKKVQ